MANITREDQDQLNTTLTLTLSKDDYNSQYIEELKKYRKHANLKGFRKGKTPIGAIKKMYGRAILGEILNKKIQEELDSFIEGEKLDILGQPLPAADQGLLDIDPNPTEDFVFKFDLGLAPEFEIQGISADDSYQMYKVEIPQEEIDDQLDQMLRRAGKTEEAEVLEIGDTFEVTLRELDDKEALKEDGIESSIMLFVNNIDESIQDSFIGAKPGDVINAPVKQLEKDPTESYLRKYLLKIDEDVPYGDNYAVTINKVNRLVPAEANQEFFDSAFGEGEVSSLEEAKAKMNESMTQGFNDNANSLLFSQMIEELIDKNELEVPEGFLKRWLVTTSEKNTPENVDQGFAQFKRSLTWTLISNKIQRAENIEVKDEEVKAKLAENVMGYFGAQPGVTQEIVDMLVQRSMENQEQVDQAYNQIVGDRILKVIKEKVTILENPVSRDEFNAIVDEWRNRNEDNSEEEE